MKDLNYAIKIFNTGRYFECHDVLEELWKQTEGKEKDFYKGLIHAAVAMHLLSEKRIEGAIKRSNSSIELLRNYEPSFLNINTSSLIKQLENHRDLINKEIPMISIKLD